MPRQEDNLYSPAREYESAQVEVGTVGWEGTDEHFEKGTEASDGHTLIYVTLYRGRDPSTKPEAGRAQGMKILCHISDSIFRIPKKGTRCYVIVPHGMEQSPGAGVIVACVSPSPTTQFEDDRVVMDFGEDVHVVLKGKSVALSDHENPARFIGVGTPRSGGTPGVQILLPDGTGAAWQDGAFALFSRDGTMMQATPSKFEVWVKDIGCLRIADGEFYTYAPINKMQGAGCYIGKLPTVANMALWGPTGIAGVASPSVFISPV